MELVTVPLDFPEDANIIFGQSHFIKVKLAQNSEILRDRYVYFTLYRMTRVTGSSISLLL